MLYMNEEKPLFSLFPPLGVRLIWWLGMPVEVSMYVGGLVEDRR